MSSWKRKKPIGNFQSSYVRRYYPENEIIQEESLYSYDKRSQYKVVTNIDDSIYQQLNITTINELIEEYENFFNNSGCSRSSEFGNKLRSFRYNKKILYSDVFDVNFVDLFRRLLKFIKMYNNIALESFCELFISTPDNNIIDTFLSFYLMNFNKKYYDYI